MEIFRTLTPVEELNSSSPFLKSLSIDRRLQQIRSRAGTISTLVFQNRVESYLLGEQIETVCKLEKIKLEEFYTRHNKEDVAELKRSYRFHRVTKEVQLAIL